MNRKDMRNYKENKKYQLLLMQKILRIFNYDYKIHKHTYTLLLNLKNILNIYYF